MKNINKITESQRGFVAILITMVCILGGLGLTTIIASAAVTPGVSLDEADMHKVGAKKVSDTLLASCERKFQNPSKPQSKVALNFMGATVGVSPERSRTEVTHPSVKAVKKTTNNQMSGNSTLRSSVSTSLMDAFEKLGFEIHVDSKCAYVGCFSASKHTLEMRSASVGTFRHEMGHFLDTLKNMPSKSSAFASIYKNEKANYIGANVGYVTKNAQEYFAQSYRNYLENQSKLKADRPLTYTFIQKQIASISKEDITRMYNQYSWSW
jgi:hypothetical protein